ncbi:glycoside hydrolase family 64 protein [Whalleya microplaca]|nr:glycoside hydrolase family 64 protein [Whalleya microplaca]
MRCLLSLAVATAAAFITTSLAAPIVVNPGGKGDLIVTAHNTINGSSQVLVDNSTAPSSPLKLSLVNNFGGKQLNAYVTGQDTKGSIVMLSTNGSWYYPNPAGSASPVAIDAQVALPLKGKGEKTELTLPDYISSGRIWIADGELQFFTVASATGAPQLVEPSAANPSDPSAAINWGFVELTNTEEGGIYANISFVDFVGLIMGMSLTLGSGEVQTVQGLSGDAIKSICSDLKDQAAKDGQPWDEMCVTDASGNPLRVMAPNLYLASHAGAMEDYYDDYNNKVWEKYSSTKLTIDTQTDAGKVTCQVDGDQLKCDGDNRGYPKPTVADIWGCNSGPFAILNDKMVHSTAFGIQDDDNDVHRAIVPRLCAAFTRSTLLIDGGDVQPSSSVGSDTYYKNDPTNHYSRIVHKYEVDGKGYAFSYDDVNPDGQNEAGVVSGPNPQTLELTIGGPSS